MGGEQSGQAKSITIVVPVFNEAANVAELIRRIGDALSGGPERFELLFVDDGSRDDTWATLQSLALTNPKISAIALSRNFGKEAAIAAGVREAKGDAIILMDADLQHPPEILPSFLEAWRAGSRVVFGLRQDRVGESRSRMGMSKLFYALFKRVSDLQIPEGATDFMLLDRQAVDAVNQLGERNRFSKGLFSWIGFRSTFIPFPVGARYEGVSRWKLIRLGAYAIDAFSSFSSLPLKVWSYVGILISLGAILYAVYFAIQTLVFGIDVPGFPSLIISIMFFSGVQLISLGVMGEYLARLFLEVKQRPLYLVAERIRAADGSSDA